MNPGIGNVGVGADYFQWYGGYIGGSFPFIFYNGGDNRIDQVQICAANKPEVLAAYSSVETYPGDWHVHIPEDECQTTGAGWRLEGRDHHFEQTELGLSLIHISRCGHGDLRRHALRGSRRFPRSARRWLRGGRCFAPKAQLP